MDKCYTIEIAGVKRDLPLCPLNEDLYIGAFVMFGDVELTEKAAAALLKNTEKSVLLVAKETGYDSQSRFTAAFKQEFGVLPTNYRKKSKGENQQ